MKKALLILFLILSVICSYAQDGFEHLKHIPGCFLPPEADSGFWWSERGGLHDPELEYTPEKPAARIPGLQTVQLSSNMTLHFLSPQPIQYSDISVKAIEGDLPMSNLLRIRLKDGQSFSGAIVTIAGQDFIAQYQVIPDTGSQSAIVEIKPADCRALDMGSGMLTNTQLRTIAMDLLLKHAQKRRENAKGYGITAALNHVFTFDDYIFLDLGYRNSTNLKYDIGDLHFSIEDKKVTRATNVQSVTVKPEFILLDIPSFKTTYRNVFAFRKFTYPGNKVLKIELAEKQLSGRVVDLTIPYKDILEADAVVPN